MITRKHKIARVRKGLYNYRGYGIHRRPGRFTVLDEDNRPFASERTLSGICLVIDRWEQPRPSRAKGKGSK